MFQLLGVMCYISDKMSAAGGVLSDDLLYERTARAIGVGAE